VRLDCFFLLLPPAQAGGAERKAILTREHVIPGYFYVQFSENAPLPGCSFQYSVIELASLR
jgi:hypothetical protein